MAIVRIPALMRDLTAGADRVTVEGQTVGEVIDNLDKAFPGAKARLVTGGDLSPSLSVVVDGKLGRLRLRQPVAAESQVSFIPAVAGG